MVALEDNFVVFKESPLAQERRHLESRKKRALNRIQAGVVFEADGEWVIIGNNGVMCNPLVGMRRARGKINAQDPSELGVEHNGGGTRVYK